MPAVVASDVEQSTKEPISQPLTQLAKHAESVRSPLLRLYPSTLGPPRRVAPHPHTVGAVAPTTDYLSSLYSAGCPLIRTVSTPPRAGCYELTRSPSVPSYRIQKQEVAMSLGGQRLGWHASTDIVVTLKSGTPPLVSCSQLRGLVSFRFYCTILY